MNGVTEALKWYQLSAESTYNAFEQYNIGDMRIMVTDGEGINKALKLAIINLAQLAKNTLGASML